MALSCSAELVIKLMLLQLTNTCHLQIARHARDHAIMNNPSLMLSCSCV
jgi:hypothetical protein